MKTSASARVGDIASQIRGVTYAKDEAEDAPTADSLPILRANNITDNGLTFDSLIYVPRRRVSEDQILRSGDVLVATSSGSLDVVGKAAPLNNRFCGSFGAFCKVLRPSKRVNPSYFSHFFRTPAYRRRISGLAAGANINNLRNEHLDDLEIPLPPLEEQRRIAVILDKADDLRQKRRTALQKLDSLTQSIFLDMFGDPTSNPKDWAILPLGEIVDEFRYGTSNKSEGVGKPALRIPNVIGGALDLTELKTVPVDDAEFHRLKLEDGDLLFVRTNGNQDNVGRCAVFERKLVEETGYDPNEFIFASYLIRARFAPTKSDPIFLREFLLCAEGRRQLKRLSKTSAGQFNVNTESLGAIRVLRPPISSQQTFSRRVKTVDKLRMRYSFALKTMNLQFASLQHRAFRGEL